MGESETVDGVLLDSNLHGQSVEFVATALKERGLPFTFVTGYGRPSLPIGFDDAPILAKPFTGAQLLAAATALLQTSASEACSQALRGLKDTDTRRAGSAP
jgi:DNA-binding response OmpR family regulator